jgi:hypothetical protein
VEVACVSTRQRLEVHEAARRSVPNAATHDSICR